MNTEVSKEFLVKLSARASNLKSKTELRRKQMRTAKKQSSTLVTMQEDSDSDCDFCFERLPPLNPDRRCIEFENAISDETCWAQWDAWDAYCEYVDWNDQCEAVDQAWYDQDLDWQYPPPLRAECINM